MIELHEKAVLHFSGGKDSLACLYMLRPYWHKLIVMWCNTGAAYPETLEEMEVIRALVPHFQEVKSDQPAHVAKFGLPADVVPVRNSRFGMWANQGKERPAIQSYLECCTQNIFVPLWKATKESGATLVIRGQRLSETRHSPSRSGDVHEGISLWFPLEDWSESDVRKYLDNSNVPLPAHYSYVNSSLDCWSCTAYMDDNKSRIQHMKKHQPLMWKEYEPRLKTIVTAVNDEMQHLAGI